MSIYRSNL